jgi:hypothetical protein
LKTYEIKEKKMDNNHLSSDDITKLKETKRIVAEAGRKLKVYNERIKAEREETLTVLKKIRCNES